MLFLIVSKAFYSPEYLIIFSNYSVIRGVLLNKKIALIGLALLALIIFSSSAFALAGTDFNAKENLRQVRELAGNFDFATRIIVFVLSVGIAAVALKAYSKTKSKKIMIVGFAFTFFALKWFFKILTLTVWPATYFTDPIENVFELIIIALLFIALFRK